MEQGQVNGEQMFVTDGHAAELPSQALVRSIFQRRL